MMKIMVDITLQTADWKQEKHAPVIEVLGTPKKGEPIKITVSVGKQIPHPNKTEHHIAWIQVFFLAEGEKNAYQIGQFDFSAHGASTQGADKSTVYTNPEATISFKSDRSGELIAMSFCNIHGLWKSNLTLKI